VLKKRAIILLPEKGVTFSEARIRGRHPVGRKRFEFLESSGNERVRVIIVGPLETDAFIERKHIRDGTAVRFKGKGNIGKEGGCRSWH